MNFINIPNKDTNIFISLAKSPGNTGSKFHNLGSKIKKINNIYIPLRVNNFKQAKAIIKNLNYKGCSLSMPFKESCYSLIDYKDSITRSCRSINTILKKNNKLYGFNTDYYAAKRIFENNKFDNKTSVLLLGNGGVARTIYSLILKKKMKKVFLISRNLNKYQKWKCAKNHKVLSWKKIRNINVDLLINATPIGMFGQSNEPSIITNKKNFFLKYIYDLPVNKKNKLSIYAKKHKIKYISGLESSFYQALKQFEIYNKTKLNEKKMKSKLTYSF
jgi:shikimate dehydrogenase